MKRKKLKVAFQIMGIGPSVGGGGAQRFFAMMSQEPMLKEMGIEPYLLTDTESYENFKEIGSLKDIDNVLLIKVMNHRFYRTVQSLQFLILLIRHRFDIIHIGNYNGYYAHLTKAMLYLPKRLRPKLILNIVDCQFAPFIQRYLEEGNFEQFHFGGYVEILKDYPFDGVYSWYRNVVKLKDDPRIFPSRPLVDSNDYCFTDYQLFSPNEEKGNHMLFAANLRPQKNPIMFVKALKILFEKAEDLMSDWKVSIYGKGRQEEEVRQLLKTYGLDQRVEMVTNQSRMDEVFPETKLFISTQNYENFTSLSMLEAMASGNSIVARDVGQTNFFVKEGENGFLAKEDSPEGVAEAIISYLKRKDEHEVFQRKSHELAVNHYNKSNFINDLVSYWQKLTDPSSQSKVKD